MPANFLAASGNGVSAAGVAYLSRLLPPAPAIYSPFV